jgi:uncharacterized protein (TIGR02271 family)
MNYDSSTTRSAYDSTVGEDGYETAARDDAYEGRAIVAVFADRETAHAAAHELHDEGFQDTWIGVTRPSASATTEDAGGRATGGTTVETDGGGSVMERIGRFFSGEGGTKTLYDELVRHGVAEREARSIDGSLEPNSAILTVDGSNHPELAAEIIEQCGGHVLAGESFGEGASAGSVYDSSDVRGSQVLGYGDAGLYARGTEIDDQRRLQLREERLSMDKTQVPLGEATIRKDVVERRVEADIPTVREELFVEYRPASEMTSADMREPVAGGEIGGGETVRVPLMREAVSVTKRAVIAGEVLIGKRKVEDVQHVSETTREERLHVDDPTGNVTPGNLGNASGT